MKRGTFILSALALYPLTALTKLSAAISLRTGKGFKINAGEARFGEHYKMKGITMNVLDIKVSSKDTDGELAIFEQTGHTPNGGPPLHLHMYQDEIFYVLEGEYFFQVGDEKHQMKTGDTIFLPRNIPHGFIQLTEKARMIVSFVPAGKMEDFFKVTDSWTSPPSEEEIARVMEEHEMKLVGPPLKVN